jgi:hypothetical protein
MDNGCRSSSCGATAPRIITLNASKIPAEVQDKINKMGISGGTIEKCMYCGTVWIEYLDKTRMAMEYLELGTRDINSQNMIWYE